MRAWVLIGLLLVAAGVVFFMLRDGEPTREGVEEGAPGVVDEAGGEKAPELLGAGGGRPHVPTEIRGRGSIQGTVRRRDEPVAATVELRHVAVFDPEGLLGGGMFELMIERILDAGISTKEVIARTNTGADGAYRFGGLAPGLYEVRATVASGAVGFASATLPAEGARVEASIEIPSGGERLAGRVVYADGKPYQGLVLALGDQGFALLMGGAGGGGEIHPTRTDEDGRFAFDGLAPGPIRVSAVIPGVMRILAAPITLPHPGEYLLTLDVAGVEASGRVISAATEEPIEGATVFAGGGDFETSFSIRTTTTDADGRFKLVVPATRGGMFAKADGYAPESVEFSGNARTDLVVSLEALARVSGRVLVQGKGTPVEGVSVMAFAEERRGGPPGLSGARTDAQGRYELNDVMPGSVRLVALGAGWHSVGASGLANFGADEFNPNVVQVAPGGAAEMDLEVMRAARATGRVTTSDGEPVVGCVVQPGQGDGLPGPVALLMGLGYPVATGVTDAEGHYVLDTLVPNQEYRLSASAPDHPAANSEPFKAVGGQTHEVDLQFAVARWLDLQVIDAEDGTPVAGARVLVRPAADGSRVIRLEDFMGGGVRTGPDGHARVGPLPAGKLQAQVTAEGYAKADAVEIHEIGPDDLSFTVELKRGQIIAGRVIVPTGIPVQGVGVTIHTEWSQGADRNWVRLRPPVAADGSFRADTLPDGGKYRVQAEASWEDARYVANVVVQGGDEEVLLELKPAKAGPEGPTLTVRIVDHEGEPVPSGRIQLYAYSGDGSSSSSEQRFSSGATSFDSVEEARELWLEVWRVTGGERGATFQGPLAPGAWEVEVRLPAARSIEGTVTGPDGQGVRGVRVVATALHPSDHASFGEQHGVAFSDAQGRFHIQGLGDLEYQLSFQAPPEFAPEPVRNVRAGAKGLRVTLRAGVSATLTVLDYEGEPVAGAGVSVTGERTPPSAGSGARRDRVAILRSEVRTDVAGTITLRSLPPDGGLRLRVSPPDARADLQSYDREGWTPQDETIKLARALTISGVVKDLRGKPVPQAWVGHRPVGKEQWTRLVGTNDEGEFEIRDLAPGPYELGTHIPGALTARDTRPAATVEAGATGVVLNVDLGASLTIRVRDFKERSDPKGMHMVTSSNRQAHLMPQSGTGSVSAHLDEEGRVRFQGLEAGTTHTLSILGLPGGHYVLARDLRPGDDETVVEMQKGGRLDGRIVAPAGVSPNQVFVGVANAEGARTTADVDQETWTFRVDGLPEDSWRVHASARVGGKRYKGAASVNTGGEVVIELTER